MNSAGGIVFTPDAKYAFVAARADNFNTIPIDQTANPLYVGGNVAIIADPLGTNPHVIAATRPIPFGYPVDLQISPDGEYLYVSYQGIRVEIRKPLLWQEDDPDADPLLDHRKGALQRRIVPDPITGNDIGEVIDPGEVVNGGVMVYSVTEMRRIIENSVFQPLSRIAVNDLFSPPVEGRLQREPNPRIDVHAAYAINPVLPGQAVFYVYDASRAPLATGGFPGGIAIQKAPQPQITALRLTRSPDLQLQATDKIKLTTQVDVIQKTITPGSADLYFTINTTAKVTLRIDNARFPSLQSITNKDSGAVIPLLDGLNDVELPAGTYRMTLVSGTLLGEDTLSQPGDHPFTLQAVNREGAKASASGIIVHELEKNESYPVGHTIIKGVDIWDGHLTLSSQDVSIPGRGLSLDFSRTYSSAGDSSDGPLGAGWTHTYNVRLVKDSFGHYTVQGGEGSGNSFGGGQVDPDQAALFGLPANALFYEPQVGFHSTLVKADPGQDAFDFYTKSHIRYHFELEPELTPLNSSYTLQYIEEPNGNKIELFYHRADPRVAGLAQELHDTIDQDPTTLDVVRDSSGRAFMLRYQEIAGDSRIVQLTGYDPTSTGSDLGGLDIEYRYDEVAAGASAAPDGNLTSVVRKGILGDSSDERIEHYGYQTDKNADRNNLDSYTDPNKHETRYVYRHVSPTLSAGAVHTPLMPSPGFNAAQLAFFGVLPNEIVEQVIEPGGATDGAGTSVIEFTYNFSTSFSTPNTRRGIVRRKSVPATVYTLNSYGATNLIQAPWARRPRYTGLSTTTMSWICKRCRRTPGATSSSCLKSMPWASARISSTTNWAMWSRPPSPWLRASPR